MAYPCRADGRGRPGQDARRRRQVAAPGVAGAFGLLATGCASASPSGPLIVARGRFGPRPGTVAFANRVRTERPERRDASASPRVVLPLASSPVQARRLRGTAFRADDPSDPGSPFTCHDGVARASWVGSLTHGPLARVRAFRLYTSPLL